MTVERDFSSPRPDLIVGPGFSVEVLGRTGLRYTEGEKVMLIDSEVLAGTGIALYQASMLRWERPSTLGPPGPEERVRIIGNIRRAFEFKGDVLQVI